LVEFVVEKVGEHLSAKDMVGELEPVLDNEAEPFVIKLWRMLIYETLKANEKA
jgi:RNA-binding protein 25